MSDFWQCSFSCVLSGLGTSLQQTDPRQITHRGMGVKLLLSPGPGKGRDLLRWRRLVGSRGGGQLRRLVSVVGRRGKEGDLASLPVVQHLQSKLVESSIFERTV